MTVCERCGTALEASWKFCVRCGARTGVPLPGEEAPAAPAEAVPATLDWTAAYGAVASPTPAWRSAPPAATTSSPEPVVVPDAAPAPPLALTQQALHLERESAATPAPVPLPALPPLAGHDDEDEEAPPAPRPAPGSVDELAPLAILALVLGIVLSPLAAVFGIAAILRIRRTGERGRPLAVAGVALGIGWTGLLVVAAVALTQANGLV